MTWEWNYPRRVLLASLIGTALPVGNGVRGQEPRLIVPPREPVADAQPATWGAGAAEVVYEGTPAPGRRVVVGPDGPFPDGTSFRWEQVEGPAVALDDPTAAQVRFIVPVGATRLGFLLTIRDDDGERTIRVTIPVTDETIVTATDPGPTADAGDDQIGLVGRQITLNGARSRPEGRVGFRWVPLSGPGITEANQDGPCFSFVPTAPGLYRFALVVGLENRVSEPDEVQVEVGARPGLNPQSAGPPPPLARWLASAVASVPQGAETAARVAGAFEAIAQRMPLYTSYSEIQSELARRLEEAIPDEPARHDFSARQVFEPLSQVTGAELVAVGIDPRSPSALLQPLDATQRERIQIVYQGLAGAFRSRLTTP